MANDNVQRNLRVNLFAVANTDRVRVDHGRWRNHSGGHSVQALTSERLAGVIANFKKGEPEGHVDALNALKGKPLLLGYAAAFHGSVRTRSIALREITDKAVVCLVIRSTPFEHMVNKGFDKLKAMGRLGELGNDDLFMVAIRSYDEKMRVEASGILQKRFPEGHVYSEKGATYADILAGKNLKSVEMESRKYVYSRSLGGTGLSMREPFELPEIRAREKNFVPENLTVLFSADLSTL